jgi:hypothetical protein
MKTNVSIELDEAQLNRIARLITGTDTKRTATRKEVTAYAVAALQIAASDQPLETTESLGFDGPIPQDIIDWIKSGE